MRKPQSPPFSALFALLAFLSAQAPAQSTAADKERISVWYVPGTQPPSPRFDWPSPKTTVAAEVDQHLQALRQAYAESFCRMARDPFARKVEAAGARVVYASRFAPAAVIEGDKRALERVRDLAEVRFAFKELTYAPETDSSAKTTRADAVARLPLPVTGKGVKQCVLEANSVQAANPYLGNVTYFKSPSTVAYARHPTAVAGIIASQHTQYRGVAPGVTLLSANAGNFLEATLLSASDWAIKQGANTINASFGWNSSGALRVMDYYFDHVIRHLLVNFIKGAGNSRSYVVSPGLGFNSITVGNSFDQKTPHWSDDTMNASSGYLDPTTGQPKPEIVAPGTNLTGLLHLQPWIGVIGSGGSYAGPQGNAVAALLMERNPALKLHPEAIKAVIMASAWHKIETKLIGDRDGAGQLHAYAADAVVRQGSKRLRFGELTPASFGSSGVYDLSLNLDAHSETRAVLSWASDPASTYPYSPGPLKMDLDLIVFDPSMQQVASSTDTKRSFEIVRFVPQRRGMYTFRLKKMRFDGQKEPYGLAVSQAYDMAVSAISGPASLPVNRTSSFVLSDPYHPGRAYAAAASLSGGGYERGFGYKNRSIPIVVDPATWLSLGPGGGGFFLGYAGSLDSAGKANLKVALPLFSWLIGLELSQVGVTFEASTGAVLGVTPAHKGKIVP